MISYLAPDHSRTFLNSTRDVFYVRREVDLMKTAKVNAYIMHLFGKLELLSILRRKSLVSIYVFS